MKKLFIILTLGLLFAACAKDNTESMEDRNFNKLFGGKPYIGTARGVRSQPGTADYTWNGEGRVAVIEASGDSVSVVFMADFADEGEINLKFRGKIDGSDLRLEAAGSTSYFLITNEQIDGKIENASQSMVFDGILQRGKADMTLSVYFKQTDGAFPAGSTLNLQLNTSREIPNDEDNDAGCQMRLVPIWSPNGITMGMVPDC
ncbi:hypothetical protein M8998_04250 [Sphingobacterium sp. lm-10]|uniref:hypothetical protein n=1 Tax=Sphingobacterium sp. lm-10 TaxID=2944904 RepID=UPI0020218F64|nr:hypothetical protein [Sphingobacterium sp. lm-10]MCL7987149.1 hypothetical protein [Sphingobacterium sp. lm-10]